MFRGDIAQAAAKNPVKKGFSFSLGASLSSSRVSPSSSRVRVEPSSAKPGPSKSKKKTGSRISFNILTEEVDRLRALVPEYLADAVRDSTKKTYRSFWERYKKFCSENTLPLNDAESVSIFLIALAERTENRKSSLLARHALKYFFETGASVKKVSNGYLLSR